KRAKQVGEPEDQARQANDDHVAAGSPEVELLPVGPALEGRFRPQAEEPPDHPAEVFHVAPRRQRRIVVEDGAWAGLPVLTLVAIAADQSHDVTEEADEGDYSKDPVPDAGRVET